MVGHISMIDIKAVGGFILEIKGNQRLLAVCPHQAIYDNDYDRYQYNLGQI